MRPNILPEKSACFRESFDARERAKFLHTFDPMRLLDDTRDSRERLTRSDVVKAMPAAVPSSFRDKSRWTRVLFFLRVAENSLPACLLVVLGLGSEESGRSRN